MKNKNTSATIDSTGVSEWWFTRNIIAGFFGIAASLSLNIALDRGAQSNADSEAKSPAVGIATR